MFGGASPGTIYELQMYVPQDGPGNVDALLNVYSYYLFSSIFTFLSFRHVFQMQTVHTFGDYYRWSFLNRNTINRMGATAKLEHTLWEIRQQYGQEFMDRAMLYTMKRWQWPKTLPDPSADFQKFFAGQFIVGMQVVDNRGAQAEHILAMLKQKELWP
jgi:hypothetical protein